jgi:hypothetical protein
MAPVSHDFLKTISVLSLPTLKIDFVQISVYESRALLPGIRNCLLFPSPYQTPLFQKNVGESKQFRRPGCCIEGRLVVIEF